jgi:hypothetical protein
MSPRRALHAELHVGDHVMNPLRGVDRPIHGIRRIADATFLQFAAHGEWHAAEGFVTRQDAEALLDTARKSVALDVLLESAVAELKGTTMAPPKELPRPIELAALKGRIDRARREESRIGELGRRYDKVLDAIADKRAQAEGHVGHLERYDGELGALIESMTGGSNNPPDTASDGQGSTGTGEADAAAKTTTGG